MPGTFAGDINWGPHHYDFVTWVVDPDPGKPVDIEFDGGRIHYHFDGGVVVHSYPYPHEKVGGEGGACFVGTKGRLAVDRNALVSDPGTIVKDACCGPATSAFITRRIMPTTSSSASGRAGRRFAVRRRPPGVSTCF